MKKTKPPKKTTQANPEAIQVATALAREMFRHHKEAEYCAQTLQSIRSAKELGMTAEEYLASLHEKWETTK